MKYVVFGADTDIVFETGSWFLFFGRPHKMSLDNICVSESLHLNMDINHDIVLYTIQYFSAKQDLFPATDKVKECQCKVFTYNGWLVRLIHAAKSCNCSQYWYITLITQHLQQAICYVIPTTTAECANTHHTQNIIFIRMSGDLFTVYGSLGGTQCLLFAGRYTTNVDWCNISSELPHNIYIAKFALQTICAR